MSAQPALSALGNNGIPGYKSEDFTNPFLALLTGGAFPPPTSSGIRGSVDKHVHTLRCLGGCVWRYQVANQDVFLSTCPKRDCAEDTRYS